MLCMDCRIRAPHVRKSSKTPTGHVLTLFYCRLMVYMIKMTHALGLPPDSGAEPQMTFDQLEKAMTTLHLGDRVSLHDIKQRYRSLVRQHHPDRSPDSDNEEIRKINDAYKVLCAYCDDYRFSFSREEFLEQNPEERLREQFGSDPLWGSGQTSDE